MTPIKRANPGPVSNLAGFYCVFGKGQRVTLDRLAVDDFSTGTWNSGGVTVVVQAGAISGSVARDLGEGYLKNSGSFKPSRETQGSFLLVDLENDLVLIGRDRSQAYHLYVYEDKESVYVTTDINQLIGTVARVLDPVALDYFLLNNVTLAPYQLLKGVDALLPGHIRFYKKGNLTAEEVFWQIEPADVPSDYKKATEHYGELFLESIRKNATPESGVFLSGGSDSAAVVAAMSKLNLDSVQAAHMAVEGHFPIEREDVKALQAEYDFPLHYLTPPLNEEGWLQQIDAALDFASPNSNYSTIPTYLMMGQKLSEILPKGSTVFNGEMCLLDQGFSVEGDSTRNFRRNLYLKYGAKLTGLPKVVPNWFAPGFLGSRKCIYSKNSHADKLNILFKLLRLLLHSVGRPVDFYAGMKLGFSGLPGMWMGRSYLPVGFGGDPRANFMKLFFEQYEEDLRGDQWKQTLATMGACWYSETSNFTMPYDSARGGELSISFPFSSVELMDYAASLPTEWTIDKKIQKDMCAKVLGMPDSVAYRQKNHTQPFNYYHGVYKNVREQMEAEVQNTNYGILDPNIKLALNAGKIRGHTMFALYGISRLIKKHQLSVG
jgi:hypothetical protein